LEPIDPNGDLLIAEGSSVQFNPKVELSLDVETFQHKTRPNASAVEIRHALSLYTGDLLEDIYDDWCTIERDRLRQIWLEALGRYSQILQSSGKINEAISIVQKWVNAEPFDEAAQRRLMSLYAVSGERAKAIQTYHTFAQSLAYELDTEPLPETQALLQSIQNGHALAESEVSHFVTSQQRKASPQPQIFPALPFIGRHHEIASLEEAHRLTSKGSGRLVLVTGEPGIGKTRLLQEYLAFHPDLSSLQSACYELDSMVPFAPLRQALEGSPLLYDLAKTKLAPAWASTLIPILPALGQQIPYATFSAQPVDGITLREALVNLIIHLSESCLNPPFHLILDDLHWADTPTWELLASLTRRVISTPLLIIGLLRVEDLPAERQPLLRTIQRSDSLWTLELPRLTSNETADLARHLNPQDAGNTIFIQRLYQETEGNPFFIVETVRALQETGGLQMPVPLTKIPNSIQRVIEARLDRLSNESREALACAASIGRSFTYPLLQEILGDTSENIITYIEEWLQRGLVLEGKQGYDFRHDKFRQVAYAGLSRARREYIHGRIADVLEHAIPPADVTTLAYHYARSDQPLRALPYLTQAGEQALRLRSYHEARQFGLQAVNLLGQLPGPRQRSERIDINLQLAQAYAFTGDMKRAIEILNETEHLAMVLEDEARLGQIFRRAAQFFWLHGQPETASDYARRTLRVAEELGDTELLYASLRMLGRVSIALAAFDDAIAHLLRYVNIHDEIIENEPLIRPPEDLSIVLGYLGVAYSRVGAWERAISVSERGLSMAEAGSGANLDATTIFARMQLAMVQASLYRWNECLNILSSIPKTKEFEELNPPLYMVLSLRGYALAQTGEATKGAQLIQSAVNWAEQAGHRVFHYLPRLFLAESLLLAGKIQPALREVKIALRDARGSGNRWAVGIALKLQADISTRLPHPKWTQVESDLIESMHLLRQIRARPDLARTYLSLRRLYDRAGQIAWAVDCHFRATTIFDELEMDNELRFAQGQAARERQGAVVIPNLPLRGPNVSIEKSVKKE
jgi:tetratricopeptide (TPR) repeat protein